MRNFQVTFETGKRSFINTFSICMTVPSKNKVDVKKTGLICRYFLLMDYR